MGRIQSLGPDVVLLPARLCDPIPSGGAQLYKPTEPDPLSCSSGSFVTLPVDMTPVGAEDMTCPLALAFFPLWVFVPVRSQAGGDPAPPQPWGVMGAPAKAWMVLLSLGRGPPSPLTW